MHRAIVTSLLVIFLTASAAHSDTREIVFTQDGLARSYLVTVPDGLVEPAPLVVAVHGLLEDASSMRERVARGRLDIFAEQYGFVVVYPSAWGRVWNIGEGHGARRLLPPRDDLEYLARVVADVRANIAIDPARIFIVGYSLGGMTSFSLACRNPGLFRAVAAVASQFPDMFSDDCANALPDGVLLIHGTDDDVIPFEGGPIISGPLALMEMKSFADALAYFTRSKGCDGAPEMRHWDEKPDGMSVLRSGWYECSNGGAVEGYEIVGGGHRWPSGGPILPMTGSTTREIDGTAAVWGFFSRFQ
jgi:polyhydroxybutyrate depolymerase